MARVSFRNSTRSMHFPSATAERFTSLLPSLPFRILKLPYMLPNIRLKPSTINFMNVSCQFYHMSSRATVAMETQACGSEEELIRPCVDCGMWTGCFCDHCCAADRLPNERWSEGQMTPLCSSCDNARDACHFCFGRSWCTPPPWSVNPAQKQSSPAFAQRR